MADTDPGRPLEPWTGYEKLSPQERLDQFNRKSEGAKKDSDQAYGMALAAAVGNYELLRQVADKLTPDEKARDAAHDLHIDAGSWKPD